MRAAGRIVSGPRSVCLSRRGARSSRSRRHSGIRSPQGPRRREVRSNLSQSESSARGGGARDTRARRSPLRRPRPALRVSAADVCKQKREQNLGSSQGGNHPTRTAIGLYRTRIFILYKVWLSWGGSDHGRVSGVLYKVRPPRATGRARTSRDSATVPLRTAHAHVDTHERVCARMCVARWLEQPAPR